MTSVRILGIAGGLALFFILLLVLVITFEIWMFIHAARNNLISQQMRIFWLVGMVLLHPIMAIAYFFTDHKK